MVIWLSWNTTDTVFKKNEVTDVLTWKNVYNRTLERRLQIFAYTEMILFIQKKSNHIDACHTKLLL